MNIGIHYPYDGSTLLYAGENEWDLSIGDLVIFSNGETKKTAGKVVFFDRKKIVNETILTGKILRKANKADLEKLAEQEKSALAATEKCREKVTELDLPMQIISAIWTFDESELNFCFSAEARVDFRELVPQLAGLFKKRIHLQQVGARDRAKAAGGYGVCGRELCCEKVLPKFHSVTMDMARTQEMSMKGADKLSGPCGKLLCCLAYEVKEYEKLRKGMPYYGSMVETPRGIAKVIGLDVLNQKVKVWLDTGGVEIFTIAEVKTAKKTVSTVKGATKPLAKPIAKK